ELFGRINELGFNKLRRNARVARIVMHLAEIWTIAEAPGLWQLLGSIGIDLCRPDFDFIQEPGQLGPAAQTLLKLDLVWPCATKQDDQLVSQSLVSNRLRVQENGHNRLLNLAVVYSRRLGLNDARLR